MARGAKIVAGLVLALAVFWLGFRLWPVASPSPEPRMAAIDELGVRSDRNLIGVSPVMTALDYRNAASLRAKLGAYLEEARRYGKLTPQTIVVFPEHIGTWLAAAGAPAAAYAAPNVDGALAALAAADPISFLAAYFRSSEKERAAAAIFRLRTQAMARDYQDVFSGLARDYGVTIVAGSIVLENPRVEDGRVVAGSGPLYNASAVFGPDGRAASALVLKVHPIPSESGFLAEGAAKGVSAFDTPAGRLGVLICADSWHPELYRVLREEGAEVLAVPAFLQPDGVWMAPWRGYVTPAPDDIDPRDAGRLTEGEAWRKYSMAARAPAAGIRNGVTPFLRGDLWDLGDDGRTIALGDGALLIGSETDGATITVVWLKPD